MRSAMLAKKTLAAACDVAGVHDRRLSRCNGRQVAILMYHRVAPFAELPRWVQAGMVVEPGTFERHLEYLKQRFEILRLDDLAHAQGSPANTAANRPRCVLTFDDGWADFVTHAYPILRAHRVPATVFLPTDYIGTERWFWTDRLGFMLDALSALPKRPIALQSLRDPLLQEIVGYSGSLASKLERAIAVLKRHKIARIEESLEAMSGMLQGNARPAGTAFMTWAEVNEIHREGLVTFGSHTAGHPILTTITDEEAVAELQISLEALVERRLADKSFVAFCYPNGGTSMHIRELVRQAGYRLAVTTRPGWNDIDEDPFMLKRIGIHQDISSTPALFASRITAALGVGKALQNQLE